MHLQSKSFSKIIRVLTQHHELTTMDILFAQIQADLRSNDALRQSSALLQALQQFAAGRDISVIAKSAVEEIVASPASAVCKKKKKSSLSISFVPLASPLISGTPSALAFAMTFAFLIPMSPPLRFQSLLLSPPTVWESSLQIATKRSLTVSTRLVIILGFRSPRPLVAFLLAMTLLRCVRTI